MKKKEKKLTEDDATVYNKIQCINIGNNLGFMHIFNMFKYFDIKIE